MPAPEPRPVRAQVWALAWTFLPVAVVAAIGYAVAYSADDPTCDGFACPSFGYGLIGAYAASAAPLVAILGQLATAGLGALAPPLRRHPAGLGLLGALTGWLAFVLVLITY